MFKRGECVSAHTRPTPVLRGPTSTLQLKILPHVVHFGKALRVNQCKLGEVFLSCRVGIFYRLKDDQFYNTFEREDYLYIHEICMYVCMYVSMYDRHVPEPCLCVGPTLHLPRAAELHLLRAAELHLHLLNRPAGNGVGAQPTHCSRCPAEQLFCEGAGGLGPGLPSKPAADQSHYCSPRLPFLWLQGGWVCPQAWPGLPKTSLPVGVSEVRPWATSAQQLGQAEPLPTAQDCTTRLGHLLHWLLPYWCLGPGSRGLQPQLGEWSGGPGLLPAWQDSVHLL